MKTPLVFDEYTGKPPEHEMDQDLKKALKDMTEAITALVGRTAQSAATGIQSTGTSIEGKLEKLDERSNWHRSIGWGIVTLYGLAFVAIITYWIPRELYFARDGIKGDTAAQLLPIQLQLAKITALAELRQSKDVAQAIQQSADFSTPRPAIEAVRVIAQQAKADKLEVPPSVLQGVNAKIQNAVTRDPKLNDEAWSARLALVDYRSALQEPFKGTIVSGVDNGLPFPSPKLPVVQGSVFGDGPQKLDGVFWKNTIFQNVQIEYDGGPMALQNVRFINCTFMMKYTPRADKFADLILSQSKISGSLS